MLRLEDRWLWDFWLARAGADFHLFFLQAPRELGREELRHAHASVGHAVSRDLADWSLLPDALAAGPEGTWDDRAIWTGSVVEHEGGWSMLYTGTNRAEGGLVQRIGLATSSDLVTWEKHAANPVLEADPRWYELLDLSAWHDQAWRDPWLFRHPADGAFHALITARARSGPADGRGVIGHARSRDLVDWEVLAPLTRPGDFGELEVPQLVAANGRFYVLFSSLAHRFARRRSERSPTPPVGGTFFFVGAGPLGPFELPDNPALVADRDGSLYGGKLVADGSGAWQFLAFRNVGPDGTFVGELSDPSPVEFRADGSIGILGRSEFSGAD